MNDLQKAIKHLDENAVTTVDLSHSKIGPENAIHLAKALETNQTLTALNLFDNKIGNEGVSALAKALETNHTLTALNLQYNEIGSEGVSALAEALKTNHTLTTLDLSKNWYNGSKSASALADTLKTNHTLTTLVLTDNAIDPDGAKALAEALKTNHTLTTLDLNGNRIGNKGAKALAEALRTNHTLAYLDLMYNQIEGKGVQALAKALNTNHTLTYLGLTLPTDPEDEYIVRKEDKKVLAEAIANNGMLTSIGFSKVLRRDAFPEVQPYLERNKRAHERCRAAAVALVSLVDRKDVRSTPQNPGILAIGRDHFKKMAKEWVWSTRWQDKWWLPSEGGTFGQDTVKRLKTNACIGCGVEEALYMEKDKPSRVFCDSYCQFIEFHGLSDVRGMTVEQINAMF